MSEWYNASTLIDANLDAGRADRTAIWSGNDRITYRSLFDRICAMSRALRALGIERENRVLLVLSDTPAFPFAFFGAMRIGAIPVPINPLYKAEDFRFFLEDSYARVVIAEAAFLDKLTQALDGYRESVVVIVTDDGASESPTKILNLDELLEAHTGSEGLSPARTHRDDMAFWLYSSGSTGKPKAVVHLHQDIPATCDSYARHVLKLTEDDIVFGRVLFHAYGLGNSLTFPFSAGASSVLAPGRPTPRHILDVIERFRPTVLCLVPTLYNAILNDCDAALNRSPDVSSLRLCISAAEPLSPDTWRRWRETFGQTILDGIGSTEMLHIFCSNTLEAHKPGSSGKPIPGYELQILDDDGRVVAVGETGNLFVKGASAAPFYWHQRERSRRTMRGEWTATGDRYRVDADGFYWYEGRADDMLKVGGEWVSPIEIENVLMEHAAVAEAAAVGVIVEGVTRIRAVVILALENAPAVDLVSELQEWCKTRLQRYRYPHIIDFVDELPKTATGKIQRFKLRGEKTGLIIKFETSPESYQHWKLTVNGDVATLAMNVEEDVTLYEGYKLKLNSYDLGVDIELADAVERLRFEHPEVRVVVITSVKPRIFCSGANIYMLGASSHADKVNFCKFTNETRCAIEDASQNSGQSYVAALNGTASGGGYELALACDEIYLVDDGNAAVSLPEVALLGVLPGTGGLTRLVDKRKYRRDRADVFSTMPEGLKAKRAKEWNLIDGYFPTSRFDEAISARAQELAETKTGQRKVGSIKLSPLQVEANDNSRDYRFVSLQLNRDRRYADVTVRAPDERADLPSNANGVEQLGDAYWPLRAYRELDNTLLHLRMNEPEIGLVCLRTQGEIENVLLVDKVLAELRDHWLIREIILYMARTLRRLDLTAKSFFAIIEPGSSFAGNLLELALAADRSYMLSSATGKTEVATSELNAGALPMSNGLTRLQSRFLSEPEMVACVLNHTGRFDSQEAFEAGIITSAPDELDWDDEIRLAIEERTSLSPDALTGMEASLRFGGPETTDTKIFGRLTAWQNWIFQRPNAVGEHGALTNYGKPTQAKFDFRRT